MMHSPQELRGGDGGKHAPLEAVYDDIYARRLHGSVHGMHAGGVTTRDHKA